MAARRTESRRQEALREPKPYVPDPVVLVVGNREEAVPAAILCVLGACSTSMLSSENRWSLLCGDHGERGGVRDSAHEGGCHARQATHETRVCVRCRCFHLPETAEAGFPDIDIRLGASVSIRLARSEDTQEAVVGERAQNAKKATCLPPGGPSSLLRPLQCVSRRTDGGCASAS